MTEHNAFFYHEMMLVYNYDNTASQFHIILQILNRKKWKIQYCLGTGKENKVIGNLS